METACELARRLSKPSLCLDVGETRLVRKLAEVAKRFVREQARAFVVARTEVPLAEVLIQDCTPLRTCEMHVKGEGKAYKGMNGWCSASLCSTWSVRGVSFSATLGAWETKRQPATTQLGWTSRQAPEAWATRAS